MDRRRFVFAFSIAVLLAAVPVAARALARQNPFAVKPQKEHDLLAKLAGKWDARFELHMPGAPPMESKATEVGERIGGLWLVSRYEDPNMMGERFSGVQILGYDPAKKKYVSTWVDSQSAELGIQAGTYDDATKTLTLVGESPDPMTGKPSKSTSILHFVDDDHRTSSLLVPGPDGKDMPMFTIEYARAK